MKLESLVIANQHVAVNTFSGLYGNVGMDHLLSKEKEAKRFPVQFSGIEGSLKRGTIFEN